VVPPRRRLRGERGASAVELAFIAPAFVFLIFFCIQAALFFYGRTVAIQAAREGVSQLRLAPDRETFDQLRPIVLDNTERFASTVGRESLIQPQATATYDDAGGRVTVQVRGNVISLLFGIDLSVTEQASGPVERFEPQDLP
jgi:Flp pilus assembly protein TadG